MKNRPVDPSSSWSNEANIVGSVSVHVLVYEGALACLAVSFLFYALILRYLLALVGLKYFWFLPMVGALLLVVAGGLYFYANAYLIPQMSSGISFYKDSMKLRSISIGLLMLCGVLNTVGGWLYYRKMGK